MDAMKGQLTNDKTKWCLALQSVQQLGSAIKLFNGNVDKFFDDIEKIGCDGSGCSIDMQQRLGGGKCQISHVIDAMECTCYAIDVDG